MTDIHKIPVGHVEVGMYVSGETPGLDRTGLNSRGLISRKNTVDTLLASGVPEIYIDISKGKSSINAQPVAVLRSSFQPRVELKEELKRAAGVYSEARSMVGNLIANVKLGRPVEVGPIEQLAEELSGSVLANSNALLCMSQIREKAKYLLEHSINVGILMGVFGCYLGYKDSDLHQLVIGGLLHDIGKIRVPDKILNKKGRLTKPEWEEMKRHVIYGEEALANAPGLGPAALAVVMQHHEKLCGGGYPRDLSGDEISTPGRLASIVDIYDAVTADRCYHEGRSPFSTMQMLLDLAKNELDESLVYQFVRCVGIYPVGTLVALSNKFVGVVTQSNSFKPDMPEVKVFYDLTKNRELMQPFAIDLADHEDEIKIVKAIAGQDLNIQVRDVI